MQDRFHDLREKIKSIPGSRRKRAALLGIDHSTLGRFERGVSQTLYTLGKIERGLARVSGAGTSSHLEGSELDDQSDVDASRAVPKASAAR